MSYKVCFQYLYEEHRWSKAIGKHITGDDKLSRRSSRTWAKDKVVARRYERRATKLFVAREIGIDDSLEASEHYWAEALWNSIAKEWQNDWDTYLTRGWLDIGIEDFPEEESERFEYDDYFL